MASLRTLATARQLNLGAAVAVQRLRDDEQYRQTLAGQFNQLVAENAMKFGPLHPQRDRFDWTAADDIVHFAAAHHMAIRGHTLAWHHQMPDWLTQTPPPPDEFRQLIREHAQSVARRFSGRLFAWDAVNEALADDGTMRPSLLLEKLGSDWVADVFSWARQADPHAKLFYNDYGAETLNPKSDAVYRMAQDFLRRRIPLDGVGMQFHIAAGPLDLESVRTNIRRLRDLGLAVHITELDIRLPLPATEQSLTDQARLYAQLLQLYLDETAGDEQWRRTFTLWGFTDRSSWVPSFFKGYGAALLFDDACQPKPAYEALRRELTEP